MFDVFLALDRLICSFRDLEINHTIDPVTLSVAIDYLFLMFEYGADEILCDANVQSEILTARNNISVEL